MKKLSLLMVSLLVLNACSQKNSNEISSDTLSAAVESTGLTSYSFGGGIVKGTAVADKTFTIIKDTSSADPADTTILMEGDGAFGVVSSTGCNRQLTKATDKCLVKVRFLKSSVAGTYASNLKVGESNIALSASVVDPAASLTAKLYDGTTELSSELNLGSFAASGTLTKIITVKNETSTALTGMTAVLTGSNYTKASDTCTGSLASGKVCYVKVTFKADTVAPVANEDRLGSLTVSSTATGAVAVVLPLKATLTGVPPLVADVRVYEGSNEVSSLSFGDVSGGTTTVKVITVKNVGSGATAAILPVSLTGSGYTLTSNTCAVILAAGKTCGFRVSLAAGAASSTSISKVGSLVVGDKTLEVSANVLALAPASLKFYYNSLEVSSLDFGSLSGTATEQKIVTVKNEGGKMLSAASLSVTGSSFVLSSNSCVSKQLSEGESCSFKLAVSALNQTPGSKTGSVSFDSKTLALSATITSETAPETFSVTLVQPLYGTLSSDKASYNDGETALVTLALDTALYQVTAWTNDCSSVGSGVLQCSLIMNANKTVGATVSLKPVPSLTMNNIAQTISGNLVTVSGQATNIALGTQVNVSINGIPYIFAVPPVIRQVSTFTIYSFQLPSEGMIIGSNLIKVTVGGATVSKSVVILEAPVIAIDPVNGTNEIFVSGGYTAMDTLVSGTVTSGGTEGQSVSLNYYGSLYSTTLDAAKKFSFTIPQGSVGGCCGNTNSFFINVQVGTGSVSKEVVVTYFTRPDLAINLINGGQPIYQNASSSEVEVLVGAYGDSGYVPELVLSFNGNLYTNPETVSETMFKFKIPMADINASMVGQVMMSLSDNRSNQTTSTAVEIRSLPAMTLSVPSEVTVENSLTVTGSVANAFGDIVELQFNGQTITSGTVLSDNTFSFYPMLISASQYPVGSQITVKVIHYPSMAQATKVVTVAEPKPLAVDDSVNVEYSATPFGYPSVVNMSNITWMGVLPNTTGGTMIGNYAVGLGQYLANPKINFTITAVNVNANINIDYSVKNPQGVTIGSGTVIGTKNAPPSVSFTGAVWGPGAYTLTLKGYNTVTAGGQVTVATAITGSVVAKDDFYTEDFSGENLGNLFDGSSSEGGVADELLSSDTTISVTNYAGQSVNNITQSNPMWQVIDGRYGQLAFSGAGGYRYVVAAGIHITQITEKEEFTYTLTTIDGKTSSAKLRINFNFEAIDNLALVNNVISSIYPTTWTLGQEQDILTMNLFKDDNTGGNGVQTWADFSLAQADSINLHPLIVGTINASNAGDFITFEYDGPDTKIFMDRDGIGGTYSRVLIMKVLNTFLTIQNISY